MNPCVYSWKTRSAQNDNQKIRMTDKLRRYGAFVAFFAMMSTFAPATAGGVAVTLSPNTTSVSPADVSIQWTASSKYVTSTTITITTEPAFTEIKDNCGNTQVIDLNGDTFADGSITATTTNSATYLLSAETQADLTMSLCLQFVFPVAAQNYTISMLSSNPVDFGSALLYAHGGNQVVVTGTVPASLTFSLRNSSDLFDTHVCELGVLSLNATSTCAYRLRIATNAANGFQAQINANQDFGTGMATMTNLTDGGAQPAVGFERYGISRVIAATEGGRNTTTLAWTNPISENAPVGYTFDVDPSPVPVASAQNFISYGSAFQAGGAQSATTTSFVEHAASITAGTAAGLYSQTVTYTVTGSF